MSFFISVIAFCGIIIFADGVAVPQPGAETNIDPADMIDVGFDPNSAETPTPSSDLEPPPPDTINQPRKITFDYRTEFIFDFNTDVQNGAHNIEDEEASQWLVVTRSGYEYDGSPEVLREIFTNANNSFAGSIEAMISQYGDPASDNAPDVGRGNNMRSKRTVFFPDSRVRVYNPSSIFPTSAMGQVGQHCTGTFIGPRHILTAGHCVYNYQTGQWIGNINFRRAKDCDPDGGTYYQWVRVLAPIGWTTFGFREYNYALIVVNQVSPFYMSYGWHNGISNGLTVNLAGYPTDKIGQCMWYTSCTVTSALTDLLLHQCDSWYGMHGSAVYVYFSNVNSRIVYCINTSGGTSSNECARITATKFEQLQRWIRDY